MKTKTPFTDYLWENLSDYSMIELCEKLQIEFEYLYGLINGTINPDNDLIVKLIIVFNMDMFEQTKLIRAVSQTTNIKMHEIFEIIIPIISNYKKEEITRKLEYK